MHRQSNKLVKRIKVLTRILNILVVLAILFLTYELIVHPENLGSWWDQFMGWFMP